MKMKIILLAVLLTLVGCKQRYGKIEGPSLPRGLSDCEVYETEYGTVIRCPETTTITYPYDKIVVRNMVTNTKNPPPAMGDSATETIPTSSPKEAPISTQKSTHKEDSIQICKDINNFSDLFVFSCKKEI
jgi:hypothetical protein